MKKILINFIVLILFVACGGKSSSDDPSANNAIPNSSEEKIGYFIDSAVGGLAYTTSSGTASTTQSDGKFTYSSDDNNITFKAGNIIVGSIQSNSINTDKKLFIQDLIGVSRDNIDDEKVLKIAQFLQSLDTNLNDDSITLNSSDLDKFTEHKNINDINLTRQLAFASKSLKSLADTKEHLGHALRTNGIALYNYTPQANDFNVTTFKNIVINSTFTASDKNDKYLQYIIESNTTNGTLELIPDTSSFKYIPNNDFIGTDTFTYKAYDGEKYSKIVSINITVKDIVTTNLSDTIKPTAPSIVSLNSQENSISLFWLYSNDNITEVSNIKYEVHMSTDRNFTVDTNTLKQTLINTIEADISSLNSDQQYYIKVKAIDEAGNFSLSEENSIKTAANEVVVNSTAKLVKAIDLHLEDAQKDTNILIFEDSKKADIPIKNDILVGNIEDRYLRRVVSVNKTNNTTEVVTKDVSISEVIEKAKVSSKTVLFGIEDVSTTNTISPSSLQRSVRYRSSNIKEETVTWGSGRFSNTKTTILAPKTTITARATTQSNNLFSVKIVKDDITVKENQTIAIEIDAVMKQDGKDDGEKFRKFEFISLKHDGNQTSSNDFSSWFKIDKLYSHEAKATFKWTARKKHVSADPYIAKFKVCSLDTLDNNGLDGYDLETCETIKAKITVIGDGKVDTGGTLNKTFNTHTEFTNDVTLDFTPTLVVDHEIDGSDLIYAKVSLTGKLDFDVLTKFKYSVESTKEYKKQLVNNTYTSVYLAGPVPIYQTVTFTVDAQLKAISEGSIEATSDLDTSFEIEAGLEYKNKAWHPITKDKITKDYTATIQAAGGVFVEVRLVPNVEIKFYEVASAGLSVEPYLNGNIAASGTAKFNTDLEQIDTLAIYKVDKLNLTAGIEGKIYASLDVWKVNLVRYPEEGKKTIFDFQKDIFNIPTIQLKDNGVDICSQNEYKLISDITNPTSLVENNFSTESISWRVFPEDGATIEQSSINKKEASFTFTKQDEYEVYMIGHSEKLGNIYGQQYATFDIDTRDCTITVPDKIDPIFTPNTNVSVYENQTSAITLIATDENTVSYSISDYDSNQFNINKSTGIVTFKIAPDFEVVPTKTSYSFTATATDEAQNKSTQEVTVNILDVDETVPDTTKPTVTITDNEANIATTTNSILFTFTWSEDVNNFDIYDTVVSGGIKGTFTNTSNSVYTLSINPNDNSTNNITIDIQSSSVTDNASNANDTISQYIQAVNTTTPDTTKPTVTITDNKSGTATTTDPITFTFTFSETISGFDTNDIVVAGGSKGTFGGSGTVYTLAITPNLDSKSSISIDISANSFVDSASNANDVITQYIQEVNTTTITPPPSDYGTITSAVTGKVWLDRNLGALQVCTSFDDTACYGDYYQWGRDEDGHEKSNSTTTSTQATNTSNVGHGDFITGSSDWASVDSDGSTRQANWNSCPSGYRIPTLDEFNAENVKRFDSNSQVFNNFLKLSSSGIRMSYDGSLNGVNNNWTYWTLDEKMIGNSEGSIFAGPEDQDYKANGFSVRCIQDTTTPDTTKPTVTITDNKSGTATTTDPITFTFTFSETISGFDTSDIVVSGGTKGTFGGSGTVYTLAITPNSDSTSSITIDISATSFVDSASNANDVITQYIQEVDTSTVTPPSGYGTITSSVTGKVWLDRNLGASQVCTSFGDTTCYGDYYQWGRDTDGHEKSNSTTTSTQATNTSAVGHGDFIKGSKDWASTDSDGTTRQSNWNPCPFNYRIPTIDELTVESINNKADAYSKLKLPSAGLRNYYSSQMVSQWSNGYLWTSSLNGANSKYFAFYIDDAGSTHTDRAGGLSIRCIRD